jgi:hypothetical protein
VGGIGALAVIAGIAFFLVKRRNRQQAIRLPADGNDLPPAYEKDNNEVFEMYARDDSRVELAAAGKNQAHEMPAVIPVHELGDGSSRGSSRNGRHRTDT